MSELMCTFGPSPTNSDDGREEFTRAIHTLRSDITAMAAMVTNDAKVRFLYQQQIQQVAQKLESQALMGQITWREASRLASELRNDTMEMLRGRSSPVGKAIAEFMKAEGLNRETLLTRYTERLYGKGRWFSTLSSAQQDAVYAEIVVAAGRSSPKVNLALTRWSRVGRGLIVLSVGLSIYKIAMAEDPGQQAVEEVAVTAAGIAGGIAGGAAAGLICGPGAPVCSTVGALVGGALAAFGMSSLF